MFLYLNTFKLDPLYLLEFLIDTEERSKQMERHQPSVYKNILAIGLSKLGKIEMALDQMDSILLTKLATNETSLDGIIFPNTVSIN